MNSCPTVDELDRWLNEQVEPAQQARLAEHIDSCPTCQTALENLTRQPPTTHGRKVDASNDPILRPLKETVPISLKRRGEATDHSIEIPGYDLGEPIGRGGMGVVYKARQHRVNRLVAIKLLDRPAGGGEDSARLLREGEVLGRLQHPNIVQVHDVGVVDDRPYLAMEYVAGGTLSQRSANKPLPPEIAASLVEQVARAVQHAHDHGVLHRDLKPSNILLHDPNTSSANTEPISAAPFGRRTDWQSVPAGPAGRIANPSYSRNDIGSPKVTDFGVAKAIDQDVTITQTGVVVGTPSYMAPEQVTGAALTPACDIYGLGAILYELLTGRPPFAGPNAADVLVQVRDQDPVAPSVIIPNLPRNLNTICLKCLEKEPNKRYATAWAVAEDLRRWRSREPILARPASTVERAWKWARRRKAAAALVALGLFLLIVGLPTVTGLWLWADVERRRTDSAHLDTSIALDRAERSLYAGNIAQSELFFRLNDMTRARAHLQACEPAPGQPDRRGWEWYYLQGLLYSEHQDLPILEWNEGDRGLYAVAFSPDGKQLAAGGGVLGFLMHSGTEPGQIHLWDAGTGNPLDLLKVTTGLAVTAAAFDPTGGRLFILTADVRYGESGTLQAWDLKAGKLLFEQPVQPALVRRTRRINLSPAFAVSSDGRKIAVGNLDGLSVIDAQSGASAFNVKNALAAQFGADATTLITLGPDWRVVIRDVKTGDVIHQRVVPFDPAATAQAFSPSGKLLAWGTARGDIQFIRLRDEKLEARRFASGHAGPVSAIAIDGDDRLIATGGADGTVRIWDLEANQTRQIFRGHSNRVTAVAFNRGATRLASVGWGPEAKVWDLTRQPEFANITGNPRPGVHRVEDCVFTNDGHELLVIRVPAGELERWDPITGKRTDTTILDLAKDTKGLVISGRTAAFSSDGRRLAAVSGLDPELVKVWNTERVAEPVVLSGAPASIGYVAINADGSRVAAAVARTAVRQAKPSEVLVWDALTGKNLVRIPLNGEACSAIALSADGRRLATAIVKGDGESQIRIWDLDAGKEALTLPCEDVAVAVTFDTPGSRLAAATHGPRVLLWNAGTGEQLQSISCLETYYFLAFAPDGRRLAGATREVLTLWDSGKGEEVLTLRGQPRSGLDPPFNPRIAFDPKGNQLAVSQADNTVTIWTAQGYAGK